jgi:hypothetical protein
VLVTEDLSKGESFHAPAPRAQMPSRKDRRVQDRGRPQALNVGVTPDAAIDGPARRAERAGSFPILSTVIGSSTVAIPRSDSCGRADGRLCESPGRGTP